jgi:hypothetical protein
VSVYLSVVFCFTLLCCLYSEHETGAEERGNEVKEQTHNFHWHIRSVAMLLTQHFTESRTVPVFWSDCGATDWSSLIYSTVAVIYSTYRGNILQTLCSLPHSLSTERLKIPWTNNLMSLHITKCGDPLCSLCGRYWVVSDIYIYIYKRNIWSKVYRNQKINNNTTDRNG